MLMPSLFGEYLLDDFFDVPNFSRLNKVESSNQNIMHTDVKEKSNEYEIIMNLPGFKKEDVKAELKDGYLLSFLVSSKMDKDLCQNQLGWNQSHMKYCYTILCPLYTVQTLLAYCLENNKSTRNPAWNLHNSFSVNYT